MYRVDCESCTLSQPVVTFVKIKKPKKPNIDFNNRIKTFCTFICFFLSLKLKNRFLAKDVTTYLKNKPDVLRLFIESKIP